jgi:threonine/homoserine/homoserine lactone efflux protein
MLVPCGPIGPPAPVNSGVRPSNSPHMSEYFLSALSFGLAAGVKPGPLGVFVIQQTLSRGLLAGVRASLAPLITDGPIIIASLWFLSHFKSIQIFAAAMSLAGGIYLLWLGLKMLRVQDVSLSAPLQSKRSFSTAVRLNFLNPGPYLFWFTVGGSYIIRGTSQEVFVFIATSIGALVGAKVAMAVIASKLFPTLESSGYLLTMKLLAGTMMGFGLLSVVRAVELIPHEYAHLSPA